MPLIQFPNIPNVPGVPLLLRSFTVPTVESLALSAASQLLGLVFGTAIWGIYDQGDLPALVPDSFLGIDFKNGSNIPTHPIEEGGFGTYNKVNTPYDCKIKMAISGDEFTRSQFLESCASMLNSIDFYSVVTPEKTYLNATLQNYSYRRESRNGGASMLIVDLWFLEVRSNTIQNPVVPADASAFDAVSGGQIQTSSYKTIAGDNSTPVWSEWTIL